MRRRPSQIAALALAATVALPSGASAQSPAELLAAATPLSEAPVTRDAPGLSGAPLAQSDAVTQLAQDDPAATLLADAGDPEQLLAQAPTATATPPAASLPRTGPELLLTVLLGGGLVLVGTGLRLRLDGAQPAVDGPR
ncbi:MAG TPA: hypothetical protein VLK58_25045 [Conexibacter sp.]|nr:hypothetical protein [Conexibacter sp.]